MAERGRPRSFDRKTALERAMRVFWEKGYAGASMADLTSAMGINSPSLYAAFGCKEALFREAVALYRILEGDPIWQAVPTAPTAREAIETVLRTTARQFSRPDKPRGCLVALGLVHADGHGDGETDQQRLDRELRALRAQNVDLLRSRLERAVDEGELPGDADIRAIASFYATLQQGMSLQARDGASRESLLAVVACAMRAWDVFAGVSANATSMSVR